MSSTLRFTHTGALFSPYGGIVHDCASAIMHHTAPWYLPWGLKLVPLPIPPGHPASGIPNPGLHLLAPLPGIYAPEPRKVREIFARNVTCLTFCYIDPSANRLPRDFPLCVTHRFTFRLFVRSTLNFIFIQIAKLIERCLIVVLAFINLRIRFFLLINWPTLYIYVKLIY